jgi:hypothetical protein
MVEAQRSSSTLPSPNTLVDWVINGRSQLVIELFEKMGSTSPRLDWEPAPEAFESDYLRELNDYWHTLADGKTPPRSSFYPEHVAYILGSLCTIDLVEETDSLHYRLYGSAIAERYGRDLTGTVINESAESLTRFFAASFRGALDKGLPLYTRYLPPLESPVKDCQRLILPFADEGGEARHLVIAHLPYRPPMGSIARGISLR